MTDRIDRGKEPWQAIPKGILRDTRLSPQAKGGLVSLLSHEEGWVRSSIATLQRENRCGRSAARAIMRELVSLGYAELSQIRRANGTFGTAYTVFAKRRVQAAEPVTPPGAVPRGAVTPGAVHTPAVVEALEEEPLDEEPQTELEPAPVARARPVDPLWEAFCEVTNVDWHELSAERRAELNGMLRGKGGLAGRGGTPDEVRRRARNWDATFGIALTPETLVRRWAELGTARPERPRRAAELPLDRIAREIVEGVNDGQRNGSSTRRPAVGGLPRVADH